MTGRLWRQAIVAALVAIIVSFGVPAFAQDASDTTATTAVDEPTFEEVARVEVADPRDVCLTSERKPATGNCPARDDAKLPTPGKSNGWLLLDPEARRGYLVYEKAFANGTIVEELDLDTLKKSGRRIDIPGSFTIIGGTAAGGAGNLSGEPLHAVDPATGRLFLPLASAWQETGATKDTQRPFSKVAVIDDDAFADGSVSQFIQTPAAHSAPLTGHNLLGLSFTKDTGGGRLLMLWAAAHPIEISPAPGVGVDRKVYDHYLTRWDADGQGEDDGAPLLLEACQRAPISSTPSNGNLPFAIMRVEGSIYMACQPAPSTTQVLRIPVDASGAPQATGHETYPLPRAYAATIADPVRERFYVQSSYGGTSWWAFDGPTRSWVGAVAATQFTGATSTAGLNPVTGRLYLLVPDYVFSDPSGWKPTRGGLQYTDGGLTPVPEARNVRPDLESSTNFAIKVDPVTKRVFIRRGDGSTTGYTYPATTGHPKDQSIESFYRVLHDEIPVPKQPSTSDLDRLTADVDEADGITDATFTGAASGYGARVLLTGGASAATSRNLEAGKSRCAPEDRTLVLGEVTSTEMSNVGVAASAAGLEADAFTKDDLGEPASRCWPAAFGAAPAGLTEGADAVAGQPWDADGDEIDDYRAECAAGGADAKSPERRAQAFNASVACDPDAPSVEADASGALVAVGSAPPPITVGSASSEVDLGRAESGIAATVDSIARDIVIEGVGTIGAVRTEITVGAAGRPKTAKTTFTRTICGVDLPTFKQSGCMTPSQQKQFVSALNSALGRNGQARLREPDPTLAQGTPGGYLAAIQRPATEAFSDNTISRDSSLAVPGLEIVIYRDDPSAGAGRQIVQLAGVQASTTYGIFCRHSDAGAEELDTESDTATLETSADTDTAGAAPEPVTSCPLPPEAAPSTLEISLADMDMNPLAGGVFEVHIDSDVDGVVGADDELVDGGTCATTADGIGDCTFELGPGAYVITQTTAPAGYAPAPPFPQLVEPEMAYTVTFQNLRSVAGVQITLSDDSTEAKPLAGGVFELIADDGDGTRAGLDVVYAGCTTVDDGTCPLTPVGETTQSGVVETLDEIVDTDVLGSLPCVEFEGVTGCLLEVPLGSYIAHQSAAPEGYTPGEDVAFAFDQPGQSAVLSFVNARAGSVSDPGDPGDPGEPAVPPTETLVFDEGPGAPQPIVQSTPLSSERSFGDGAEDVLTQILQVPAQLLRLAFNSPREVALMASVWALLFLPCYLGERRRLLARLALDSLSGDTQ